MTRIIDETFEGTGYVESGWYESVGAGSTVNEDADPADVSSPAGWGSQSLNIISSGNQAYAAVEDLAGNGAESDTWWRFELIITSEGLSNDDWLEVINVYDESWSEAFVVAITKDAGNLYMAAAIYHDGSAHNYYSTISLNTLYRLEVRWDSTNDAWEWRLNGATEDAGNLTGDHVTNCAHVLAGVVYNPNSASVNIYWDLFAVDDADWIGAEPTGTDPIPTTLRLALGLGL